MIFSEFSTKILPRKKENKIFMWVNFSLLFLNFSPKFSLRKKKIGFLYVRNLSSKISGTIFPRDKRKWFFVCVETYLLLFPKFSISVFSKKKEKKIFMFGKPILHYFQNFHNNNFPGIKENVFLVCVETCILLFQKFSTKVFS